MDARHPAASSLPGGAATTPRHILEVDARDLPRESADLVGFFRGLARCSKSAEVAAGLEAFLCVALGPCTCSVALVTEPGSDPRHPADEAVRPAAGSRLILLPIRHEEHEHGVVSIARRRPLFGAEHRVAALALHGAAAELERIAAQEQAERENERAHRLKRYVPGPLIDSIERGEALCGTERDVTVFFLDIRGYIERVSLLRCSQVFHLICRYVRVASAIVRRHGGAVVEFNGDGLMAVFGAPRDLPDKERAAVRAALEIAREVPPLLPRTEDQISIGMGIASGRGFVGDIVSEDRVLWTAIGHTTNRAARLQAATRTLDTQLLLDAATWQAAHDLVNGFESHPALELRGFPEPVEAWSMPHGAAPS